MSKQEHPYAQVLRWIADGETMQYNSAPINPVGWVTCSPVDALAYICNVPHEAMPERFRPKPRTININGHEVPEPMREVPDTGAIYFAADVCMADLSPDARYWDHGVIGNNRLARGICHSTREAAEAHARALLSFTTTGAA